VDATEDLPLFSEIKNSLIEINLKKILEEISPEGNSIKDYLNIFKNKESVLKLTYLLKED
jgi:hypothetical protein